MHGVIRTYLPAKQYGFIKGDDGRDYFFHAKSLQDAAQVDYLIDGTFVDFDPAASPKGYQAKMLVLVDAADVDEYDEPDTMIYSKTSDVRDWPVLVRSGWIVQATSNESPDSAKQEVLHLASRLGANAVIDLQYSKSTVQSGNYHYSVHHYSGRLACVGRKRRGGKFKLSDFEAVNDIAARQKSAYEQKNTDDQTFYVRGLGGLAAATFVAFLLMPMQWSIIGLTVTGVFAFALHSPRQGEWLFRG